MYKYASDTAINAIHKIENFISDNNPIINEIDIQLDTNNGNSFSKTVGIAHTRWATHGPKTDYNSHPHISSDNKFAIVHNGIIENYKKLKQFLLENNYTFKSETDSEVIANLLAYEYSITGHYGDNIIKSINNTIKRLEGTWGIAILCIDSPSTIYCTRHGSPLLVSTNDHFTMIVSEQSGFCGKVENYLVLKNNNLCIIDYDNSKNKMNMNIIDIDINENTKNVLEYKQVNIQNDCFNPFPYPHWTIKEIYEQEDSALRAISLGGRINRNEKVKLGGLDDNRKILKKINNLIILGCGTSHYAGMLGINYFKELCNFNYVQNIDAAEFTEQDIPRVGVTAMILLSQSGETRDLYNCLEIGKRNNIFLIGVINIVDSMIAREVNCGCYLNAGKEVAVASTKSFTSQVIILSMIAIWFAQLHNINIEKRKKYITDLRQLNVDIKITLNSCIDRIKNYLHIFNSNKSCFLLGKGKAEAIAKEGSLKIKELARIHAEGYSTSSLKHGPFALLEEGFPVIMIAPNNSDFAKFDNTYQELISRHAKVIFITDNKDYPTPNIIHIPINSSYFELLSVIPIQLLSYYLAIDRGLNPDMPVNLAKVVSV